MIQDIIDKAKKEHKKVYIFAHKYPDGDAINSSCALASYLSSLGIDAKYVITNPIYSFRQTVGEVPITENVESNSISIILDTNTCAYAENTMFLESSPENIYVIDHHEKSPGARCIEDELNLPNNNVIRNPSFSSTCEILLDEFEKEQISPDIANMLTTGLITDTSKLQFLRESTLTNLIELITHGADYTNLIGTVARKNSLREKVGTAKLLLTCEKIQIGDTFGLIAIADHTTVNNLFSQYRLRNAQKRIFEMADITDCSFNCIAAENAPGKFDLEFRSTQTCGNFNVLQLATEHGGGGHFNASGCNLPSTKPEEITTLIKDETSKLYSKQATNLKPVTLTDLDKELAQILTQTDRLTKNVTPELLKKVKELINQGANYVYTYKKFKTFERFMLENELLSRIPESTYSQKFPIVSIYLSKQEIDTICEKYKITEKDILQTIKMFANIDIKFATISLAGGKKVQIDRYGNITTSGSGGKHERTPILTK
jgi:phosphoesterase RecJ-like protein